jgi:ribosomal protein S18 acetylase RimI-like enzyme
VPDIRVLDELALNATAATTTQMVEGWLLRAAPDYPFRRCNSVFANGGTGALRDERLEAVAAFYRTRGLPVRYQVSPAARPNGLDQRLAGAGYEVEAPVDILVADTRDVVARTGRSRHVTAVADRISDGWAQVYGRLHGDDHIPGARIEAYGRLMRTLGPDVVVATVNVGNVPAGVGFGVIERGWMGVFGMGTRPDARRHGVATAVLSALAHAAHDAGAARCYLQVEADNDGAHALYRRASFERSYGYHYRVKA